MSQLSEQERANLVEFGEASAWADMYSSVPPDIADALGMKSEYFGSAVARLTSAVPIILFNAVLGLGVAEPATEHMLDGIIDFYSQAGVGFMVQVSPQAQPAQLPQWLEARGLRRGGNWAKVYRGVQPPPAVATDLRIERVGPDQVHLFAETAFAANEFPDSWRSLIPWIASLVGRPNWTFYLGFDGDQPVSTAGLYVRDSVGWLGFGATLPSHRRRGGQGAMFARRITDAASQGCQWLVTETGEDTPEHPNPSYHNMVRMGFELAYMRPNYVYRPTIAGQR